jgi:ATPase family associated with various cellular activities (AAA)
MSDSSYLELINRKNLRLTDVRSYTIPSQVGSFRTMSRVYARDLIKAKKKLEDYFRSTNTRPLNSLLLGPPGSGKSYLAEQLANNVKVGTSPYPPRVLLHDKDQSNAVKNNEHYVPAKFLEFNLSQVHRSRDLIDCLEQVANEPAPYKVVLLDEFDVRVGGSSVIRYLIQPMYDGKFGDKGTRLGKTAFILSGSYLKDRTLLRHVQREYSQIDIHKWMIDYFHRVGSRDDKGEVSDLIRICDIYRKYREETSPGSDVAEYLRQLEKLPDFLSRINGFVIEMPNLAAPLDVTDPPFFLLQKNPHVANGSEGINFQCPNRAVSESVEEWVMAQDGASNEPLHQRYPRFDSPHEPILQYKDMLLKERLYLTLNLLSRRNSQRPIFVPPNETPWQKTVKLTMKRSLLNYLCTVPLKHGMRSLDYLIWGIKAPREPLDWEEGMECYNLTFEDLELVARHVNMEDHFRDHFRLWSYLCVKNNSNVNRTNARDNDISVILDG